MTSNLPPYIINRNKLEFSGKSMIILFDKPMNSNNIWPVFSKIISNYLENGTNAHDPKCRGNISWKVFGSTFLEILATHLQVKWPAPLQRPENQQV